MNTHIFSFLNQYKDDPDPQYAVLLDGRWGCGKTFFIKNWLESVKQDKQAVLKPIYVSLFGLNSIDQINDAINQQLYPILGNKYFKAVKKMGAVVSAVALKYNGINMGDGNDCTIDIKLNPLMSLLQGDKSVKGLRLIVFDDMERCLIEPKMLLGYINQLVEHHSCKVIIVCNTEELDKEPCGLFKRFNEKVIGRSFLINPNTEAAIKAFVNEVPTNSFTSANIIIIKMAFEASGCSNLRVLRQAIRDVNSIFSSIKYKKSNAYHKEVLRKFLAQYIVASLELKSSNKELFNNWESAYTLSIVGNTPDSKEKRETLNKLQQKYYELNTYLDTDVLSFYAIQAILNFVLKGISAEHYLNEQLQPSTKPAWSYLEEFYTLSNEELEKYYAECEDMLKGKTLPHKNIYLSVINSMLVIDEQGIKTLKKDTLDSVKAYIQSLINNECKDTIGFTNTRSAIWNSLKNSKPSIDSESKRKIVVDFVNSMLTKTQDLLMNKYTHILENLSDTNIQQLTESRTDILPEMPFSYADYPIFRDITPSDVADAIDKLSNKSKILIVRFLNSRYDTERRTSIKAELKEDVAKLKTIKSLLQNKVADKEGVDKYAIEQIVSVLTKIEELATVSTE